jgi:hypothetical protein
MAGSLALIVVGIMLLSGNWNSGYAIACILGGAVWWHASEHARRMRLASMARASQRVARARQALAVAAAAFEIAGVLVAGGAAFDHSEHGLFAGFESGALAMFCAGLALLFAAGQLNAVKARLSEAWLASLFGASAR